MSYNIMKKDFLAIFLFLLFFYTSSVNLMSQHKISYLALGDSYTIGEAVHESDRWPVLLTRQLNDLGREVNLEKIIAITGWTTNELIKAIKADKQLANTEFQLVSLLIGVNNQYKGYPIRQYKKEFKILLEKALQLAGNNSGKVFVVSIPDYGITPFAKEKGKDAKLVSEELLKYNTVARDISLKYSVKFYDITPLSLKAMNLPEKYLAKDQLHPSAKMYEDWVDYIISGVNQQLK
jgi:lysophospholipase L1-like esterase